MRPKASPLPVRSDSLPPGRAASERLPSPGIAAPPSKLGLVQMLQGVAQVREHLVAGHGFLAPLQCQPPGPPLKLMRGPHQRLLVGPQLARVTCQVKLIRSQLRAHPLVHPAVAGRLIAQLPDVLDLARYSLRPSLDGRPAVMLRVIHASHCITGPPVRSGPFCGAGQIRPALARPRPPQRGVLPCYGRPGCQPP